MATKWLIGMAMVFVLCTIQDGIARGIYFGGGAGTIWTAITSFKTVDISNPLTMTFGISISVYRMFVGLFQIVTWDFPSIFNGVWAAIRWLLFGISLGIVVSLLLALRGTSSA